MNGEFMVEGWKYGLIEVDLMPTLEGESTPILEMWHSRSIDYVVGKRSSLAWT